MGPDDDLRLPRPDHFQCFLLLFPFNIRGKECDFHPDHFCNLFHIPTVLERKRGIWCRKRSLVSASCRSKEQAEGYRCFTGTDITLYKSIYRTAGSHFPADGFHAPLLVSGKVIRKRGNVFLYKKEIIHPDPFNIIVSLIRHLKL